MKLTKIIKNKIDSYFNISNPNDIIDRLNSVLPLTDIEIPMPKCKEPKLEIPEGWFIQKSKEENNIWTIQLTSLDDILNKEEDNVRYVLIESVHTYNTTLRIAIKTIKVKEWFYYEK